jgi:hypothetical protein
MRRDAVSPSRLCTELQCVTSVQAVWHRDGSWPCDVTSVCVVFIKIPPSSRFLSTSFITFSFFYFVTV